MRRIEELSKVVKRDGKWKRQVVEYWLWSDEETKAICKLLKINRPLLNRWHRWHFRTRQKIIKAPKWEVPPQIILWQKRQEMKNKAVEKKIASDNQNVELLQKQVAALQAALTQEKLKTEAFSTMIDIAEYLYKIEIRKKYGAKQSKA
jgi:hypothetical protein